MEMGVETKMEMCAMEKSRCRSHSVMRTPGGVLARARSTSYDQRCLSFPGLRACVLLSLRVFGLGRVCVRVYVCVCERVCERVGGSESPA